MKKLIKWLFIPLTITPFFCFSCSKKEPPKKEQLKNDKEELEKLQKKINEINEKNNELLKQNEKLEKEIEALKNVSNQ